MNLKPYEMKLISMAPTLLPGDIVLVDESREIHSVKRGEIVVFKEKGSDISVAHRVLGYDQSPLGLKTKGDRNNELDSHGEGTVFQGVAVRRVRNRRNKELRQRWVYFFLAYFRLFPGQNVPSWLSKATIRSLFRS